MATKKMKSDEGVSEFSWNDIESIVGAFKRAIEKSETLADESKDEKDYANALLVAKAAKLHFKAFLESGFNEEQAFELTKILFKGAVARV